MGNTVLIPPLGTPIHFAERNLTKPQEVGYLQHGKFLFGYSGKKGEPYSEFYYPAQREDRFVFLPLKEGDGTAFKLDILDCEGNVIEADIAVTNNTNVPVQTENGEMFVGIFDFKFSDYSSLDNENFIRLLLKAPFDSATKYFVSEKIFLDDSHYETTLIRHSHYENSNNVLWQTLAPLYVYTRVWCSGRSQITGGNYDAMEDQNNNLIYLSGGTHNSYKINYGTSGNPLPVTEIDRLVRIHKDCSAVFVDNVQYTREDTEHEITSGQDKELQTISITARLAKQSDYFTYYDNTLTLVETNSTYPQAIGAINLRDAANILHPLSTPQRFDDVVEKNTFVSLLNSTLLPAINSEATAVIASDVISIQIPLGESFTLDTTTFFSSTYCTITLGVTATSIDSEYLFKGGTHVADWGAVNADSDIAQVQEYTNNTASYASKVYEYNATGDKTLTIFHEDTMTHYYHLGSANSKMKNIGGAFSSSLSDFISNHDDYSGLASLSLAPLNYAAANIRRVTIINSLLEGITAGWSGLNTPTFASPVWSVITWDLRNNSLSVSFVDDIIDEIYDNTSSGNLLTFYSSGQTPAAIPTTGNIAKMPWVTFVVDA